MGRGRGSSRAASRSGGSGGTVTTIALPAIAPARPSAARTPERALEGAVVAEVRQMASSPVPLAADSARLNVREGTTHFPKGRVPIAELRARLEARFPGLTDTQFRRAIFNLERRNRFRVVAASHIGGLSPRQWERSIKGEGERLAYIDTKRKK